jgi:uncharacterized membrane protein (UPF0127 family)
MLIVCSAIAVGVFVYVGGLQDRSEDSRSVSRRHAYVLTNNRCVQLDVASSPEDRREGLSGYQRLADDEGMIFLYEESGRYGFWMKDMNFAIDIIWLDESNRVVGLKDNAQPDSYPQSFQPDAPAKKVVETTAGWADSNNVKMGDQLSLVAPTTTNPSGCGSD